ncbi:MAG: hypothetical protein HPY62_04950 [Bacteroidales bacterium]|nr:hypothetical protein [Bacteroidales bacterium]
MSGLNNWIVRRSGSAWMARVGLSITSSSKDCGDLSSMITFTFNCPLTAWSYTRD